MFRSLAPTGALALRWLSLSLSGAGEWELDTLTILANDKIIVSIFFPSDKIWHLNCQENCLTQES